MKASELRIGNYIQDKKDRQTTILQVAHIGEGLINYWMESVYLPIPLTPEWLERFGFEKTTEVTWSFGYEKQYNVYRKNGLTYNGIQAAWWFNGLLKVQPEYVHQLQNLYFTLTGEELTLKEENRKHKE